VILEPAAPRPVITVLRPGMLTTVQDLGRWGHQRLGIPVAGPMDAYSHRYANHLVGNDDTAAALEITLIGPELGVSGAVVCAVTGARFEVTVDALLVPLDAPFEVPAGAHLRFGARGAGARAALAVRGGLDVPAVYGSRATSIISRIGPFGGRALCAGDALPIGREPRRPRVQSEAAGLPLPNGGTRLRVVVGPHADRFDSSALPTLYGSRFVVTPNSNRMGYRLEGPALRHGGRADILSDATPIGSIQVPASGQPILLMADRQTTGGYPKIATVITADLPLAGQLAPGDWIEFRPTTRAEAVAALKRQLARLEGRP
jgi:antagonist of KipI